MLIGHQAIAFAAKRYLPEYSLGVLLAAATFLDILSAVTYPLLGAQTVGAAGGYPAPELAHMATHALATAAVCMVLWMAVLWLYARSWKPALAIGLIVFSHWLLDLIVYPSGLQLYPGGAASFGLGSWSPESFGLILEGVALAAGLWLYLSGTTARDRTGLYGCFAYAAVLVGVYLALIFRVLPPDDQLLMGIFFSSVPLLAWAAWFDEHRSVKVLAGAKWREAVGRLMLALAGLLLKRGTRGQGSESVEGASRLGSHSSRLGSHSSRQTRPRDTVKPEVKRDKLPVKEKVARGSHQRDAHLVRAWPLGIILRLSLLVILPLLAVFITRAIVLRAFQDTRAGLSGPELAREAGLRPKEEFNAAFTEAGQPDPAEQAIEKEPAPLRSALRQYRMMSDDIASILSEGLESKMKIGGALAVVTTNWQFNRRRWVFRTPEELGYTKITDEQSLVNCVKRGDVHITALKLSWRKLSQREGGKYQYEFYIEVESLRKKVEGPGTTQEPLTCRVPKGQVFELDGPSMSIHLAGVGFEQGKQLTQTYVNPQTFDLKIHPSDKYSETKIAYCGNATLDRPSGNANLTIYKIADALDFDSPEKLHEQMERQNRRALSREAGGRRAESFVHPSAGEVALHTPRLRRGAR